MLARFGLVAGLALAAATQEPGAPAATALVELPQRLGLRTLTSAVARSGALELVERMRTVLAGLGDDPQYLERQSREWERIAVNAKANPSRRATAASLLRRELEGLVELQATESEPRRSELARWILALDSEQPDANAALGRERDPDGVWLSPEELTWNRGARESARWQRSIAALDFDFERGASTNPALLHVAGGGNRVSAAGIELHSKLPPEPLERILRQALRAAALSRGVLLGQDMLTKLTPRRFVLLTSEDQTPLALEEAVANRGMPAEYSQQIRSLALGSFFDQRGWETLRCAPEASVSAVILWRLLGGWVDDDTQPCLRVGHLNWLCLGVLGTSIPLSIWVEEHEGDVSSRSSARREETLLKQALWRSARQSLWGCRSWMRQQARAGHDPLWARAMLDQDGKIRDEVLLKTTLVCEMLQQEGHLETLMAATQVSPDANSDAVRALETALAEPLPELEARWRRWIDPQRSLGVLQELERESAPSTSPFAAALLALNQARASALQGQNPEIPVVALDPDLGRAAELHAQYLTLNPGQKSRWPAMHAEYSDARGFTAEGALASSRSLIALNSDPEQAVSDWLATFYHRLPLLHPGLFGAGFGVSEEVVVLDVGSLVLPPWKEHVVVWPLPDDDEVPCRFEPELPSPVPGANMESLGYPLTIQLFLPKPETRPTLALELFLGSPQDGTAVECHRITPDSPLEVARAPENAWCLIPKAPLAKKTRYTARAAWADRVKTWSFTTVK